MASVEESYRGRHVRVFRIDRDRLLAALTAQAGALIQARPDVVEVRLFGSLARGRATPGSDVDLWVLLREGADPFLARSSELSRCFEGLGIGCDVLAYTESEWSRMRGERRRIVDAVEREGIVLARRAA